MHQMAESQDDIWKQSEQTHRSPWFLVSPIDGWIPVFDGRYTVPKTTSLSDDLPIIPLYYPHCISIYSLHWMLLPFPLLMVIQLYNWIHIANTLVFWRTAHLLLSPMHLLRTIHGFAQNRRIPWKPWDFMVVSVLWKLSCFQNQKTQFGCVWK